MRLLFWLGLSLTASAGAAQPAVPVFGASREISEKIQAFQARESGRDGAYFEAKLKTLQDMQWNSKLTVSLGGDVWRVAAYFSRRAKPYLVMSNLSGKTFFAVALEEVRDSGIDLPDAMPDRIIYRLNIKNRKSRLDAILTFTAHGREALSLTYRRLLHSDVESCQNLIPWKLPFSACAAYDFDQEPTGPVTDSLYFLRHISRNDYRLCVIPTESLPEGKPQVLALDNADAIEATLNHGQLRLRKTAAGGRAAACFDLSKQI